MSKDGISEELENPRRDELVSMGKCPGCGIEWTMTVGEQGFFQRVIAEKTAQGKRFSMPTHCRDCRAKKKQNDFTPERVTKKIEFMMRKNSRDEYALNSEALAEDLKDLLNIFNLLMKGRRNNSHVETPQSVGQVTESGSLQAQS